MNIKVKGKDKQEVLGKTYCLLSFDTIWTEQKTKKKKLWGTHTHT
jgi:hypothetical protein